MVKVARPRCCHKVCEERRSGSQQGESSGQGEGWSGYSYIWPWHDREQVVHRFIVGCKALTPRRKARWSASIRSWREPWLQVLWVYDPDELSNLDISPQPNLMVRDASMVLPSEEFARWQEKSSPIALIKDFFQLECLYLFGGWWADMDYFMLNNNAPAPSWGEWLLASVFSRQNVLTCRGKLGHRRRREWTAGGSGCRTLV